MKTTIISILSALSVLPIIIYPVIFGLSIMVFDNPAAEKQFSNHLLYWSMLGYPVLIGIAIFLAYRFNSISFAILATIPLLVFAFVFLSSASISKEEFKNRSRDFTCGPNKFISVPTENGVTHAYFHEKKFISSYNSSLIGTVNKADMTIKIDKRKDFSFTSACKDTDGKSFTEIYTLVPTDYYYKKPVGTVNKVDTDETTTTTQ